MRRLFRAITGAFLLIGLVYVAAPLWAGWQLRQGVKMRNEALLQAYVDWPRLRANLKPRISAAIKENADNSNVVSGTLKRALGSMLSDAAVETLVTPGNLRRILAGRAFVLRKPEGASKGQSGPQASDDAEDPDDPMPPKRLRWAFFETLTRFRIESVNPRLPGSRIVSTLALEGFGWKLVDVDIVNK